MKVRLSVIATVFVCSLVGVGCAQQTATAKSTEGGGDSAKKAQYEATYKEAKAARKKVEAVGFAWNNTPKLYKKAEEAAGKGDYDSALKHVTKAKQYSELAYEQYLQSRSAGPRF